MATRPQDLVDLYLAPVALGLDAELDALAGLAGDALASEIALRTNREPRSSEERGDVVAAAVSHFVETHGWKVAWGERGLAVSHDGHRLVLGVPASVRRYVDGTD